jgi:integrase
MASGPNFNAARGTWYVQYRDEKGWHRKTVCGHPGWKKGDPPPPPKKAPTEARAARVLYDAIEKAAKERIRLGAPATLETALSEHVASYRNEKTRRSVKAVVEQFVAWCRQRDITLFAEVTAAVCGDWMDAIGKTDARSTAIRKRAQLAVCWERLRKRGKVPANPWEQIEPTGGKSKPRGAWTPDEFARLLDASKQWLRDLLRIGIYTGLRINALIRLEWDDIRWPKPDEHGFGWVVIRPELDKAGKGYQVPCSAKLHELLAARSGLHDPKYVVTGATGEPVSTRNVTDRAIRSACRKAGLPNPESPNHHMRRTFGRWAVLGHLTGKPVPVYVVSKWLGHSSVKTTLVYLDLKEDDSTRFMVPD